MIYGRVIFVYMLLAFLPSYSVYDGEMYMCVHQTAEAADAEDNIYTDDDTYDGITGMEDDDIYDGITGIEEEDAYEEIYKLLDIDGVSDRLSAGDLGFRLNLRDVISGIKSGDTEYVTGLLLDAVKSVLTDELLGNRALMIQLVAVVLLGSIFVNLSGSFGSGFISENGFYITYLIITSIMLTSFSFALELVSNSIGKILTLIRIVVPVYALAMNFVGHAASGAGMYEIILAGIWLVQVLILKFIIPMIKFYVIISLVNNFNREDSFSKLCQLIKNIVDWLLKTIVVFTASLNIIKSLIEPQIDALGRTTVNRIISAVPGGGMMSVLAGTFLGAGMIIKNSIGAAGIVLLLLVVMAPVIKTFLLLLTVKLTMVMIQPIGEKRYVAGVEALAQGMSMLLSTLGSSAVLFMLTIAIMAFATNGGA